MAEPLKRGDLYFVKPPGQVMIDKAMSLPLDRLDNRIGAVSGAQLEAISASLRDWLDL